MAAFCDLPIEIWLLIANLFRCSKLKFLNSFFFNYWLDRKWKHLFVKINMEGSDSERRLRRLTDPFIAFRAKKLSISLGSKRFTSGSSLLFNTTITILPLLPNVTTLDIKLIGHADHGTSLFRTIKTSTMARTLQKLSLTVVGAFTDSAHNALFENLTELVLVLRLDKTSNRRPESSLVLETFLRSLKTLLILNITSSAFNLYPLFSALLQGPASQSNIPVLFPNLNTFFLRVNCNERLQSFPKLLHRFFLTHRTLQHVYLDLLNSPREWNSDNEKCLGSWLAESLNSDSEFPSLKSLGIYPSTSQVGLSAVLSLIKHIEPTVSSLSILRRHFTYDEARQVVDALTASEVQPTTKTTPIVKELKSLSLNIDHLSVSFLDLLAEKLPHLKRLDLQILELQDSYYDLLHCRQHNSTIMYTQDVLHTWKLQELWISHESIETTDLVRAVANAVPALSRRPKYHNSFS